MAAIGRLNAGRLPAATCDLGSRAGGESPAAASRQLLRAYARIAHSEVEGLTLLLADQQFQAYDVRGL